MKRQSTRCRNALTCRSACRPSLVENVKFLRRPYLRHCLTRTVIVQRCACTGWHCAIDLCRRLFSVLQHGVLRRCEARRFERLHCALSGLCCEPRAECEAGRYRLAGQLTLPSVDHTSPEQSSAFACIVCQLRQGVQVDTVQLPPTRKDPKGFQQTQLAGDAVKVSLQDCLACSGCVTSAETVLLEHQSTGELMAALQSSKTVIVSVSPQSRASLGVLHQQSPAETAGKLAHFLKSLGAKLVLDTTSSRDIALLEAAQEFLARYTAKHPEIASKQSPVPSGFFGLPTC